MRVELKILTFSGVPISSSIDNNVVGQLPKILLFTMIKNKDFLDALDTNPNYFQHFDLSHFTLFYNRTPIHI